jgi:hypothetical protein
LTDVELELKDYKAVLGWYTRAFAKSSDQTKADEKVYRKILTLKEAEEDFLESMKE